MRIYDPRIAKFLSVDPITAQYPELTPYQFAGNRTIDGIDLDGLEYYSVHINEALDGTRTKIAVIDYTKTEKDYGPQGDVGVNYTTSKIDKDGNVISRTGFNIKNNAYGVYAGSKNRKQFWVKPDAKGKYPDDYSLPPIDETDANARWVKWTSWRF